MEQNRENGRWRLTVAYDGTAYAGWQVQPGAPTVQAVLETALERLGGSAVKVHGSGRTDAGVHARGQVAHVDLPRPFPPAVLMRALNAILPPDVRILEAAPVNPDFHARKQATAKEYRYLIWNAPVMPPSERHDHLHVASPLDVPAMRRAAEILVGRHDFAAFCANAQRPVASTERTIFRLEVLAETPRVTIIVRGDGFLYKMVRSIAGWLIRAGRGEVGPDATAGVLASRIRTAAVPTAEPHGLFLWQVFYDGDPI